MTPGDPGEDRPLTDEEQRLVHITRRTREPVRLRWTMIVRMSAPGRSVDGYVEFPNSYRLV